VRGSFNLQLYYFLKLEEENQSYLNRLRITERDVEATKTELELINDIVNSIERATDDGPLRTSTSTLTLLTKMKQHRNDGVSFKRQKSGNWKNAEFHRL